MRPQADIDTARVPEDLGDTVIVLLGLWEMGYTDKRLLSKVLRWNQDTLRRFIRKIKRNRGIVRECLECGLPPGLYARLPYGDRVRCPLCGRMVDYVPCPNCGLPRRRVLVRGKKNGHRQARLPKKRVKAIPGSSSKLAVMQRRVMRGEQLFHPKDAKLPKEWCYEPEQ